MVRHRPAVLVVLALLVAGCSGSRRDSDPPPAVRTTAIAVAQAPVARLPVHLSAEATGSLDAPVQDAAAAPAGNAGAVLLGGLSAADVSTDTVVLADRAGARRIGALPIAVHDSAAVRLGRNVYLFGGGSNTTQQSEIVAVDPASGASRNAGRLPAASSDQSAGAVGGTAYVVGGYTGSSWLDTIVAWRPGAGARVVAHLPAPLRYAAVTAVAGRLVIAGGSLPNGTASDAVLEFAPATGRVRRLGRLPAPVTHAAAAAIGDTAYVIGGRGAALGTPTDAIRAVNVLTGRVVEAGRLPEPLSDLAAVSLGKSILLAGGRGSSGTVATLTQLVPRPARRIAQAPQLLDPANVYAADGPGMLTGAARFARPLVYVPNSDSNTVDVIDQRTFKIVDHFAVGALPQHVVPGWDLQTLYVTNDLGNSLTTIDPRTGQPGRTIPVDDPYNMYFTPDGRYAIVVAERLARLDFRDAHSFALHHSLPMPCRGVDHIDFSADGSYLLASCEFSGQLVKVDIADERIVGTLTLRPGAAPQDVKLAPDGKVFYVADMNTSGVWVVDGDRMRVLGHIYTGLGAHGLYASRDARYLYVTNRGEGSISLISFRTRRVVAKWRIPGGGSPDMGNVSADGKVLWLTGRWSGVVYAISTQNGRLLARIPVGRGPHGLCVWPQPGRYSLGHTGILR